MTGFGGNTLSYDASNKWAGGTVNGSSLSLRYDGHGRRISREVAGARTDFWHDATGLTLETGAASATYLRDPGGLLLSVSSGGSLSNYGRDRLGTITALTSGSQNLTNTYHYDPWGQAIGGSGSAYNPFQYTATYKDAATGLYQMGARYYQPSSGRFTQLDPHPGQLLTVNRYAYVGCNPTNATDPTGLHPSGFDACTAAIDGALGLIGAALVGALVALFLLGASITIMGVTFTAAAPLSIAAVAGAIILAGISVTAATTAVYIFGHACLGW
jgi:RHS repeat-associated protein